MATIKTPLGSTVPATGTVMTPSAWHALIDGLEAENFGVSDFFNGDARVVLRTSDAANPPDFRIGQVWSDPSEISHIYGDSTVSLAFHMLGTHLEIVAWCETTVSIGESVFLEGTLTSSEPAFYIWPVAVRSGTNYAATFAPAHFVSLSNTAGSEYIRLGYIGLMSVYNSDTSVTFGDGLYYDVTTGTDDENIAVAADGATFFTGPTSGAKAGVWLADKTTSTTDLTRCWKSITPSCIDRTA